MEFFKGYVETKNKKCIEKFKNRKNFSSYDDVKELPEFAGILSEDAILIDIDDFDQSEILMDIVEGLQLNCRVYETTRGKHFLFKNLNVDKCYTHCQLAIGLTADIKVGVKNSYEVLKYEGKERKVIYDIFDDEEYQNIPKWLSPVKSKIDFLNLQNGDGRNQSLFNYILTLQSNNFSKKEARECLRLINNYILQEQLDENELEVIMRDEAFKKDIFFKGRSFLFDKFALFVKNQHNIIRINNQLHIYKDGIYVQNQSEIESVMIKHIPGLNKSKRSEVMSYLDVLIRDNTPMSDSRIIAFKNGIFNIEDNSFSDLSPEYIVTNMIPWEYNADAYHETTDNVMNSISCDDKEIRLLLEEMIGYCMFRRNELGRAFILTGGGSNGKSTFLNMLKRMIGKKNLSVLDLKKLDDRFSTIMLFNKLANIGDDISDEFITDASFFKKIVTGETIDAEQKGQAKFNFEPYVKLIFSANNIPRIGKGRDSSAIARRLVIIPFNAKFDDSNANFKPFIADDLKEKEAMEYMIQLGLKALINLLKNKKFTISEKVQQELEDFEETNNPVLAFFHEIDRNDDFKIEHECTNNVYRAYQEYCITSNLNPMSAGEFSKQVKRYYGFKIISKRIGKKIFRIFIQENEK